MAAARISQQFVTLYKIHSDENVIHTEVTF